VAWRSLMGQGEVTICPLFGAAPFAVGIGKAGKCPVGFGTVCYRSVRSGRVGFGEDCVNLVDLERYQGLRWIGW
jgi:hypothetical protein